VNDRNSPFDEWIIRTWDVQRQVAIMLFAVFLLFVPMENQFEKAEPFFLKD